MPRLPFNPDLLPDIDAGPPALRDRARSGGFDAARPLTVTQVTDLLKGVLADRTPGPMSIVGEVSNFNDREHWYLSLKDEQNVIACVMWASAAKKCGFVPQRGQQVVARGRLDYYGPQGKLQFYIDKLEPVGQGALELRYRQLCEELRKLGYFDEGRKKPMPAFPLHIAVVTSAGGAALQDVVKTARQRWAGIQLSVLDVRVQGEGAAQEIAAAVRYLDKQRVKLGIDAVILTRGGGSLEDLWAFNERVVADAVYGCRVPIAVAVGHETDTSIAELVADLRCSTPTQAAVRLVPDAIAERERLDQTISRLNGSLRRGGQLARTRLDALATRAVFRKPLEALAAWRGRLDRLGLRLSAVTRARLETPRRRLEDLRHTLSRVEPTARLSSARQSLQTHERLLVSAVERLRQDHGHRLDSLEKQLASVGPRSVLARGYSYTTDAQGRVVRSVTQTQPGQLIHTHVADGEVGSRVVNVSGNPDGPLYNHAPAKPRKAGRETGGPGLFD